MLSAAAESSTATEEMFNTVQETATRLGVTFDASEPRPGLRVFRGIYAALRERQAMDRKLRDIYTRMQEEELLPAGDVASMPVGDVLTAFRDFIEKTIKGEAPNSRTIQATMAEINADRQEEDERALDYCDDLWGDGEFDDEANVSVGSRDADDRVSPSPHEELETERTEIIASIGVVTEELRALTAVAKGVAAELVDTTALEAELGRLRERLAREEATASTPFAAPKQQHGEKKKPYNARIARDLAAHRAAVEAAAANIPGLRKRIEEATAQLETAAERTRRLDDLRASIGEKESELDGLQRRLEAVQ